MSLVTGITSVVAEVISAVCAVCTNSHSAGFASSAMAELLKNSPVIKAVATVSMVFMVVINSLFECIAGMISNKHITAELYSEFPVLQQYKR